MKPGMPRNFRDLRNEVAFIMYTAPERNGGIGYEENEVQTREHTDSVQELRERDFISERT